MIIKAVQNDFFDIRIRLVENGETFHLSEGEKLEFKTKISTQNADEKEIDSVTNQVDDEGKIVFQIDLEEIKACAGTYKFEINFFNADGKKICLRPKQNNSLIILERV